MLSKRWSSGMNAETRKKYPLVTGCLDYFPDALLMVSHISYLGNEQHNPGEPLHHSRGKSMDHADCLLRHMVERDNIEHAAAVAWRALAMLQEMMEKEMAAA